MTSSVRFAVPALLGWTAFVWLSRIRNVVGNDDLSPSGEALRLVAAATFLALAGLGLWAWMRRGVEPARATLALWLLCGWTIGYWAIRGIGIIIDDHSLGFTVVHTVLMTISIGLAIWAWPRDRAVATAPDHAV